MIPIRTLIFTLLVPGTVTAVVPYVLLSSWPGRLPFSLGGFRYSGILLILAGAGAYLRCARDFAVLGRGTPAPVAAPEKLVAGGLYRFVRNPMYLGIATVLLGESVLFESPILAGYAIMVTACFHLFVVRYEEPVLRRRFGESYGRYCAAVPRWLPGRREGNRKRDTGDGA